MQYFFYEVLVNKYQDNIKFLYTDTDSLVIEVPNTFHEDIKVEPPRDWIEQPNTKGVLGFIQVRER
jgi:hypothetical protein